MMHYIRIKIFTERGKEKQSTIDIEFDNDTRVKDIAGRTIKPNGEILELKKDSIYERTIVKFGKLKIKAKSFAMPGVEPGSIIEYRWKEYHGDQLAMYMRLYFQRDIPVQSIKYYIKPLSLPGFPFGMRTMTFRADPTPLTKEKNGFYSTSMSNVPAFKEEPRMVPEHEVRPWMLVYYSEDKKLDPEKYWKEIGKERYERYKSSLKVNDDVRKAAAEAVGDAATPDEKLARLLTFCRTRIKNIYDDINTFTDEERKKFKDNESPADTLKRGYGTSADIDQLFGAMATALGMESRVVMLSDRSDMFFHPTFVDDYFLRSRDIAVKVGDQWKLFDPSSRYVAPGMLQWQQEGVRALITDPKEPFFVSTPLSPPEKTVEQTTGKLKLTEDGAIEGDVQITYTGHLATMVKEENDEETPEKREAILRDIIKKRLGAAEVTNLKIDNVTDPFKPFMYTFHIKVPNYATRTGKRLFLQPAFFQFGEPAAFANSARKFPVYFEFPYQELSSVEIELPPGFDFDNAEAPGSFNADNLIKYEVKLAATNDKKFLIYKRDLKISATIIGVPQYTALKQIFDAIHKEDNHQITLKYAAATATK